MINRSILRVVLPWAWLVPICALAFMGCGKESEDKKLNLSIPAAPASGQAPIAPAVPVAPPASATSPETVPATAAMPAPDMGDIGSLEIPQLNELGLKAEQAGEIAKAEQYRMAAVQKAKRITPPDNQYLDALRTLGFFYHFQGNAPNAEATFMELIKASEQIRGPEDPTVADAIVHLTGVFNVQGKFEFSEPLYSRVEAIREKVFGPNSQQVMDTLTYHAGCLRNMGKNDQAAELDKKIEAIKAAIEAGTAVTPAPQN